MVAVAVAVIGGVLGSAPVAVAGDGATGRAATGVAAGALPGVWPRPQSVAARGAFVPLGRAVTLVAPAGADPYALEVLREALAKAGVRDVRDAAVAPGEGAVVYAGGAAADGVLRSMGAAERAGLPSGGYRLVAGSSGGRAVVALDGVGGDGMFHAAQTLRQLLGERDGTPGLPGVAVRDWPSAGTRGITEGFYGQSWTTGQRLAQLDFLGRTKQDFYLYAPGDDPYRLGSWRQPYPAAAREDWRRLADRARRNHVTLGWAVSPGQSMCYASSSDVRALLRKADGMWALGVRAFQLQFADVSYSEWHCGADEAAFGTGPAAAARAQASVANALRQHLVARYGRAAGPALSVLPTEYYQDGTSAYRGALSAALSRSVTVAWTGVGVVPATITGRQLAAAKAAFGHPLLTMDNYPVNDYAQDRVFLGPSEGRDASVATGSSGVLANAMRQPSAARIPLFTAADYAWNPHGYSPAASWHAAVDDLAGSDPATRAALAAFAGNDASSPLDPSGESAYLRPLIDAFWRAYQEDPARAGTAGEPAVAARRLRTAFATMANAPGRLSGLAGGAFGTEVRPWLDQLGRYGRAGVAAVDMLTAQRKGDGAAGWRARLDLERAAAATGQSSATVGGGVLGPFLSRARDVGDAWTGLAAGRPAAVASMGSARATDPSLMTDGLDGTYWESAQPPQAGDWFGVDLGTPRPVGRVALALGSADDSPAYGDGLRDGVLEYSADGASWLRAGALAGSGTLTARLPAGARARFVRVRSLVPQVDPVAVRSFTVTGAGAGHPAVSGPAGAGGVPASALADGDPATAYRPAGADGGAVTMAFGRARPLTALTVLADPAASGAVTVRAHVPGHGWVAVGRTAGGFSELALGGRTADAVRLEWAPGVDPAAVHGVVPWFADAPPARMSPAEPVVGAPAGGGPVTVRVALAPVAPSDIHGTLTGRAPQGVEVAPSGPLVLRRGAPREVPLTFTVGPGTPPGVVPLTVVFASGGRSVEQTVLVRVTRAPGGLSPRGGPEA